MVNFPCICGCPKEYHAKYSWATEVRCDSCYVKAGMQPHGNYWHKYIPDNLKYLEMKYEETI